MGETLNGVGRPRAATALAGTSKSLDPDTLATAAEWQAYAAVLLRDADIIQAQLADRTREMTDGYYEWRRRANYARLSLLDTYRRAKKQAAELRGRENRAAQAAELAGGVVGREKLGTVIRDCLEDLLRDPDPAVRAAGGRLREALERRAGWDFSAGDGGDDA